MEKEISTFDAFLALKDLDDEEIDIPASRHSKLKEGKSFDVRDDKAMEVAKRFNEASKADDTLEVVDVDKDTIDNNIDRRQPDYAGDVILTCPACGTQRIERVDHLSKSDDNLGYRIEGTTADGMNRNECPTCHKVDVNWQLAKQVVAKPEIVEPTLDNDHNKEEVGFDNDEMTSTETEGEPVVPAEEEKPEEAVPEPEAPVEEPSEGAWDETDAEDDTADMKDTTGDVVDSDDVKADDTESSEEFPWDDDLEPSEKEKVDNDILFDEPEDKKEKKESLTEEIDTKLTVQDLFDMIIEPSSIREVNIFDLNGKTIYSGEYPDGNEYVNKWLKSYITSWDVAEGWLILNVTEEEKYLNKYFKYSVEEVLEYLDDAADKIDVYSIDEDEEVFSGDKDEVTHIYGGWNLPSIEAPDVLNICVADEVEDDEEYTPSLTTDDLAAGQWYESLTKKVCEANGLRYYRAEKEGSQEYWIRESIKAKEDLGVIYENFIARLTDKNLINEFKELTGYRTVLDEMLAAELSESGSFKSELDSAQKKAEAQSMRDDCDVVYGYMTSGQFYELPEMYSVRDNRELNMATELVRAKYHPTGTVYVWYKRNNGSLEEDKKLSGEETLLHNIESDDYVDPATGEHDPEMDKNLKSFKTRKELAAAIQECKNNNKPYKVTKSLTEGYRYDLLIEEVDEDKEYREGAERFVDQIKTMPLEEVEDCILDYNFEKNPPEDDVEEMIWDALKARKAELEKPVEEALIEEKSFVNEFGIPTIDPELEGMSEDLEEELPIVPVEAEPEVEVIDAPVPDENAGTDLVPEGMRPEDVEIVQKLMRISNDTANAIHEYYGIDADPRLILADMIQDLRLIGGDVNPEELANTPINELTKEMYAQYNGFTDMIEDMFLGHRSSAAQRLERAIHSLDSEEFSTPAIEERIGSDHFLEYARSGAIPFINPDQVRRIGHEE